MLAAGTFDLHARYARDTSAGPASKPGQDKRIYEKQHHEEITLMSFSGAVKLDLSDFIAPSQACVVTSLDGNKLQLADDQNVQVGFPPFPSPSIQMTCVFPQNAWGPNDPHVHTQGGTVQLQRAAPTGPPPRPPGGTAGFAQTREEAGSGAVKVTLQDCLACSGCVTSAETVLLEHQSVGELRTRLQVRALRFASTYPV